MKNIHEKQVQEISLYQFEPESEVNTNIVSDERASEQDIDMSFCFSNICSWCFYNLGEQCEQLAREITRLHDTDLGRHDINFHQLTLRNYVGFYNYSYK